MKIPFVVNNISNMCSDINICLQIINLTLLGDSKDHLFKPANSRKT